MSKAKIIVTVVVFSIVGFMLDPHAPVGAAIFGAPPTGGAEPSGAQIGLLMLVVGIQAVGFGIGVAFLAFGLPHVRRLLPWGATAAWLSIGWALVSWMPHGSLHQTIGDDMTKLIVVEYVFHVTLVVGAVAVAWAVVKAARARAIPPPERGATARAEA